jgi:hypothetical protein
MLASNPKLVHNYVRKSTMDDHDLVSRAQGHGFDRFRDAGDEPPAFTGLCNAERIKILYPDNQSWTLRS